MPRLRSSPNSHRSQTCGGIFVSSSLCFAEMSVLPKSSICRTSYFAEMVVFAEMVTFAEMVAFAEMVTSAEIVVLAKSFYVSNYSIPLKTSVYWYLRSVVTVVLLNFSTRRNLDFRSSQSLILNSNILGSMPPKNSYCISCSFARMFIPTTSPLLEWTIAEISFLPKSKSCRNYTIRRSSCAVDVRVLLRFSISWYVRYTMTSTSLELTYCGVYQIAEVVVCQDIYFAKNVSCRKLRYPRFALCGDLESVKVHVSSLMAVLFALFHFNLTPSYVLFCRDLCFAEIFVLRKPFLYRNLHLPKFPFCHLRSASIFVLPESPFWGLFRKYMLPKVFGRWSLLSPEHPALFEILSLAPHISASEYGPKAWH